MTITAPLAPTEELTPNDNLPVLVIDEPAALADDYSLLHDPIIPFLVVGILTFVSLIIAAFVLSAPLS